jgi:nucleotide-binding universal stress UspA family protein
MFKRIIVPLDGSRFGLRALRYATEVARHFSAEVILLQVVKPEVPTIPASGALPGMENSVSAEIAVQVALEEDKRNTARAKRYLRGKIQGIKSQDIKASYRVVVGEPAQSIMEFSQKEHVDLIVMTTHGKSGFRRAIMGSVADKVIRESGKPVLVVRPKTSSKK